MHTPNPKIKRSHIKAEEDCCGLKGSLGYIVRTYIRQTEQRLQSRMAAAMLEELLDLPLHHQRPHGETSPVHSRGN